MNILAIINGDYGKRHVENVRQHAPATWHIEVWEAPTVFPLIIDYPEDHIPGSLPASDLILSFAEHKGVAELIPEIAGMTGAQAVIAAVDNEAWLPRGLARQLRGWLEDMEVICATPKPLCSLTEHDFGVTRRKRIEYNDSRIQAFARLFGQPDIHLTVDPETRLITSARVKRDAVCGCARFVADQLLGISADEAESKAGLAHHHYPCLASMGIDADFDDTLLHVSGNVMKDNIAKGVKPYKRTNYISPAKRSD